MSLSPAVILYDASGVAHAVQDGIAIPASTPRLLIAGTDATLARTLRTAADGTVRVDPSGTTTQPVSAASLPLPAGAATESTLAAVATNTADAEVLLAAIITNTADIETLLAAIRDTAGIKKITDPVAVTDNAGSLTVDTPQLPGALVGARLDVNNGAWLGSTAPTVGQKAMASSIPIVFSSDQSALPMGGQAADGAAPVGNPLLVAGSDGSLVQTLLTDNQGRLVIAPSGANTAVKGFVDGQVVLAATTVVPIRSTTYTEQVADAQRSIASASAADAAAGTGARTVKITYYTSAGVGPLTETVTLDGVTFVNTVATNICFIEKIEVLTVGSGLVNAGILTLKAAAAGGGATIWTVALGANKTFGGHHYVATGKICYITGVSFGIKGADTTSGFLRAVPIPVGVNAENQVTDLVRVPSSGQTSRQYGTPITVSGPARITPFAAPDSSSSRTYYASFDFYEE